MSSTDKPRIGDTAVVVGASMAGLCAARVLSEHFHSVVVLDRDVLPDGAVSRAQVPQDRHPHLLLVSGVRILEGWFPGLVDELRSGGAVDLDISRDFYWHQNRGVWRRPPSTLHGPAMSRPFLEAVVRRRVTTLPNVEIHDRTTVSGLRLDEDRVVGVELADGSFMGSHLVVDATGRQARSLGWLGALGYPAPPATVVEVDTRYVTRSYRRTEDGTRGWKAAAVVDDPSARRIAMLLPAEGNRWILTFVGLGGEVAPFDEADKLDYARTFPSPVIADIMAGSEPLSDTVIHRFPTNQCRHVEKLRRFPSGWVMLGDAVCSFDPIYGQGMTVAAMQARALGQALDRAQRIDRAFVRRYFRAAAKAVNTPWAIAVGGDFVYDTTTGPKPLGTDLVNRYMDRVSIAAQHDDTVALRMNEVIAMVRRPEALLAPWVGWRVVRAARRSRRVPTSLRRGTAISWTRHR